ncbi:hypothetical protein CA85_24220 [Allorhodopirellula solitaria]|uniref:Uncharacterized protein n=1 Tax=Allorhodopirellula solitaria TaxID=2527987 RepID=A0A5C5XX93_9BACT|nr:hypothetical protein CA85_24220 [Allorhodopirellula solitaria]
MLAGAACRFKAGWGTWGQHFLWASLFSGLQVVSYSGFAKFSQRQPVGVTKRVIGFADTKDVEREFPLKMSLSHVETPSRFDRKTP